MDYKEFKYSIRDQFPTMSSSNIKKFYVWFSYFQNPIKDNMHTHSYATISDSLVCTQPCPATNPKPVLPEWWSKKKEENPMRYETVSAPTAIASIAMPSDESQKIDYLNNRARNIFHKIDCSLTDMFRLHSSPKPAYYKDLIDAIKNGEYKINEKAANKADQDWEAVQADERDWYNYDAFYGIDFTKFPKPDYEGREKAHAELSAEYQRVCDIIAVMPAEEALKAVQEFEKWQPSNAPTEQ